MVTFYRPEDPPRETLPETFVDRYVKWASSATDAPPQYHVINACVMLSTIMSPYLFLETSYGEIKPNIWSMILAGTTTTRKSTTMDMARKMLEEVHPDFLMGTDASPEGLLQEIAHREGKVCLFHRDEITGWIEGILKKEYLAGLAESFTRLYDGKGEKRILRRETIEIQNPALVILSGGIKSKMQEITSLDHIRSGFLPRFIIVTGTTKAEDQRPIGPPKKQINYDRDPREEVVEELYKISSLYAPQQSEQKIELGGVIKFAKTAPSRREIRATDEVWERIRDLKFDAAKAGENHGSTDIYVPIFDRLSNSVIKVAILLAGARNSDLIELHDLLKAIAYSDQWLDSVCEFADGLDRMQEMDQWEKKIDKILEYIGKAHPRTVTRTEMMRKFRIKKNDLGNIEQTMVARGQIRVLKVRDNEGKRGRQERTEYALQGRYNVPEDAEVVAQSSTPITRPKAKK